MADPVTWGYIFVATVGAEAATRVITGKGIGDHAADALGLNDYKDDLEALNRANAQQKAKGHLTTRTGQIANIPVIYGTRRVGGNEIFRSSQGTWDTEVDGQAVTVENAYLYRIVVHSYPVASSGTYEIDEVPVTVDANGEVTDTTYAGRAWFVTSTNGRAQIESHPLWQEFLTSADAEDWTATDKLLGTCFTLQKLLWDRDVYTGIPQVTVELTGSISNAVDALVDYMTNDEYGPGIPTADMNTSANTAMATIADQQYLLWGTTYGKRFETNMVLDTANRCYDNIFQYLRKACRSSVVQTADGWTIRIKDVTSTPVPIADGDIIGEVELNVGDTQTRATRTVVTYVNRLNGYKPDEVYYPTDDAQFTAALAEDNGKYREHTEDAPWCSDQAHAEDYAKWLWYRSRRQGQITLNLGLIGLKLEESDVLSITLESMDLTNALYQIIDIQQDIENAQFKVTALPFDPSLSDLSSIPVPVIPSAPEVESPTVVPAPSGLVISQGKYLSAGEVVLSWTPSTNQYVQKYSGYLIPLNDPDNLLDDGSKIPFTVSSRERSVKFGYLKEGDYTAYVKAESDLSSSPYTTFNFTVTIPKVPAVRRLELFGQANDDQFVGQDAKFSWAQISIQEFYDLGYEPVNQGAGAGALDYYLEGYEVTVEDIDGTVRRVDFVKENQYTYSFEKNLEDANRSASDAIGVVRTFRVKVKAKTKQNLFSETAAVIEVENVAPESPSGIAIEEDFYQAFLSYTAPTDPDWQGVEVHLSTSTGFTPSAATLVGKGPDTSWKLKNLTMDTTYYLRLVPYDVFGAGTTSSEFSFTTTKLTGATITDIEPETIISGSLGVELNLQAGGFIKTLHTEGASTFETYQGLVDRPSVSSLPLTFHQWNPGDLTSNFSVDAGGTLRAEGAIIEGEIVATSLTLADSTVVTGVDEITGNQIVYVYQTSATQPATPTGTNPVGWSTTPTARVTGQFVWVSQATKKNTGELIGTWSTPVEFTGDQGDTGPQGPQGDPGILPAPDNVNPGLYADSTHLGYHDSGAWKTYMDNTGKFFLTGTSGNSLYWDGVDTLTVDGDINAKTLSLSGGTVAPSVSGLYGDQSRIGYWDSVGGWQNYIAADGSFRVGTLDDYIEYTDTEGLSVKGLIEAATFSSTTPKVKSEFNDTLADLYLVQRLSVPAGTVTDLQVVPLAGNFYLPASTSTDTTRKINSKLGKFMQLTGTIRAIPSSGSPSVRLAYRVDGGAWTVMTEDAAAIRIVGDTGVQSIQPGTMYLEIYNPQGHPSVQQGVLESYSGGATLELGLQVFGVSQLYFSYIIATYFNG